MRISNGFLDRSRRNAVSLMRDTCRVVRKGRPVTGPDGAVTVPETEIYSGPCKVQTAGGIGSESTQLGGVTQIWLLYLHFPYGTVGLKSGDIATVTSTNPGVGVRTYRLVTPQGEQTIATAERWNVKEVD